MKRIFRNIPLGVWFMLSIGIIYLVCLPFQTPSLSELNSNTYYEVDGSETATVLHNTPVHMRRLIIGNGCKVVVDADVHCPSLEAMPVYIGKTVVPSLETIKKVLFPGITGFEDLESYTIESWRFCDIKKVESYCEVGHISIAEDGAIDITFFEPLIQANDEEEVRKLLQQIGLPVEDAQIYYDESMSSYFIPTTMNGLVVSDKTAWDQATGVPTDGDTHLWVSIDNGYITRIEGSWWYAEETVWDNTNIVPLSVVFDNLESELFVDGLYTDIRLSYHPRNIMGNPREKLYYPVWELTNDNAPEEATVINAITGQWELFLMSASS